MTTSNRHQANGTMVKGISTSVGPNTQTSPGLATSRGRKCCDVHCNSIWSIWYGIVVLALQAYIVYKCVCRFLVYVALPWPESKQPLLELNLYVGLVGAGVVLVPFYFISFMFKIGNLANDGYKLGFQMSACAMDPPSILARSTGLVRNAWHHGGPTAPFIHLVSAFCFVLPRIFIEAKLLEVGFLSRENIWKTDLDFMVPHRDRVIILNFLTGGGTNNATGPGLTTQAPFLHPADKIREYLESDLDSAWRPCSPEFVNYGLALMVYAVRYPAVFWNTNKTFSFLFSSALLFNGVQNLMTLGGFSIMFKVHAMGPQNVLHKYEPFLLNMPICTLLYLLSCIIVTMSSCVLYMYGYQKFMAFVEVESQKHSIMLKEGRTSLTWSYFSHCSAMCVLIALAVCNGPMLYDYTLIYKGSLNSAVLTCVISIVLHLFLWIVVWLFLTVKQGWTFKLRVTVGKNVVRAARSIKLLNDVDLKEEAEGVTNETMMIVASGKSFTVSDSVPKKLIMNTLARAAIERDRAMEDGLEDAGSELVPLNPADASSRVIHAGTLGRASASPAPQRQKVTFEEGGEMASTLARNSPRLAVHPNIGSGDTRSPRLARSRRNEEDIEKDVNVSPGVHFAPESPRPTPVDCSSETLPPPPPQQHQAVNHGVVMQPQPMAPVVGGGSGDASSTDGSNRLQALSPRPGATSAQNNQRKTCIQNPEVQEIYTPRSNRSVDSGLPNTCTSHDGSDVTPPRSDSFSSSTASPPDQSQPATNHSQQQMMMAMKEQHRKSNSMDEINLNNQHQQPRTYSLQRGGQPIPVGQQVPLPQPPPVTSQTYAPPPAANASPSNSTVAIRRGNAGPGAATNNGGPVAAGQGVNGVGGGPKLVIDDDEDPYGRCMNMRNMSSFTDNSSPRDPRIIDLNNASSSNSQQHPQHNFNTLPVNHNLHHPMTGAEAAGAQNTIDPAAVGNQPQQQHSTLPARVTGRHFKPFDHRKMNPMAEIQENPYGPQQQPTQAQLAQPPPNGMPPPVATAMPFHQPQHPQVMAPPGIPVEMHNNVNQVGGLVAVKSNVHPSLPTNLRHTNVYSGASAQPQPHHPKLVNPKILDHRDSANYSLGSSDSG